MSWLIFIVETWRNGRTGEDCSEEKFVAGYLERPPLGDYNGIIYLSQSHVDDLVRSSHNNRHVCATCASVIRGRAAHSENDRVCCADRVS